MYVDHDGKLFDPKLTNWWHHNIHHETVQLVYFRSMWKVSCRRHWDEIVTVVFFI
jgi:hypothetical protein